MQILCYSSLFFFSSSTFKDPERASLRDSGHGDSDQADSDQDTNKGSCCDMSAKEALKLKATGVKPPPLEQGERLIGKFDCMRSESCCASQTRLNPATINPFSAPQLFVLTIELLTCLNAHNLNFYLATLFSPTLFSALFSFNVCAPCVCVSPDVCV